MPEFSNYLESASSDLSLREVLREPVSALLGVSNDAVVALGKISVTTVFDLGSSSVFAQAALAVAASTSTLNTLAGDVLINATASTPLGAGPGSPACEPSSSLSGSSCRPGYCA